MKIREMMVWALALMAGGSIADTCVIVGKKASSDGCVHVGRSVDSAKGFPARCRFQIKPRVANKSGRRHWGSDGFYWPLPATTYGYIATSRMASDKVGQEVGMAANEWGLAVVALRTDAPQPEAKESISASRASGWSWRPIASSAATSISSQPVAMKATRARARTFSSSSISPARYMTSPLTVA